MLPKTADVLIIGGGVIGASIAYYLARRKVRVVLLEKGELAGGTSGACDGLVFLQSKKPGVHLELALTSQKLFQELDRQLPVPIHYQNKGGLIVVESEEEQEAMQAHVQNCRSNGLEVSLLDRRDLLQMEPHLSPELFGAAYSPLDSQVNPISLAQGLALGARDFGAQILTWTEVLDIECTGAKIEAVKTSHGRIQTRTVVNAAGIWAPAVARMAGIDLPISPRRGQILVTEPLPLLLGKCLLSARYIGAKYKPGLQSGTGGGVSMEQTESGNLLLGSTREFVGFDCRTTLSGLKGIAGACSRIIPALQDVLAIRSFAGLRPYTPDGLPILGRVPDKPGFILAAGHEGDGIALAPVTGLLIAQLITDGATDISLEAFSCGRFGE